MTQSRFAGRGKGRVNGRAGRNGQGGLGRISHRSGYSKKPKTAKVGLCKELEGNVFNYGGHGAANTMQVTQQKIHQYVGIKYGKDIANELKNKVQVVIKPPVYSQVIKSRHIKYQALVMSKQAKLLLALQAKLSKLQVAAAAGNDVELEQANLENEIADLKFEAKQDVPHKLSSEEAAVYYNQNKTQSLREATLEKHHGQVYALIYGQCTQLLQDTMKQEKNWTTVSARYKPLKLYKLIKSVVLKQTEDQYPVAAVFEGVKVDAICSS